MKKLALFVLIGVFVLSNAVFAEPKEPKVIRETKFDGEIKNASDSRVVVTDKEMIFFDADGNVRKKKALPKYSRIEFSKDGKRIGHRTGIDVSEKGGNTSFKMLDEDGNVLWEAPKFGDIYSTYRISQANGGTALKNNCGEGASCANTLTIFDKQNTKGKVITFDIGQGYGGAYPVISDDGNYFVVSFNERTRHSDIVGQSSLALYDISGNLLWQKRFDGEHFSNIAISSDGNYIAGATTGKQGSKWESHIYVYNKRGDLVLSDEVELGAYVRSFDLQEKYLIATSRSALYCFDIESSKLAWKYSLDSKVFFGFYVDFANDFIVTTTLPSKPNHDKEEPIDVYLFDISGKLFLRKSIVGHGLDSLRMKVKLLDNGRKISVQLKNKILELDNEFAK